MNCADKFLKHSERIGARFAEHNAGTLAHITLVLRVGPHFSNRHDG